MIDSILIRFKKVNRKKLAGNIPTKQARAFASQMPLPGVRAAISLNAGWLLDASESSIEKVFLLMPGSMTENRWFVNLGDYLANKKSIYQIPLMTVVATEPQSQEQINILIKPAAAAKRIRRKVQNE